MASWVFIATWQPRGWAEGKDVKQESLVGHHTKEAGEVVGRRM
jgi:hypothetical protein